MLRSYNKSYLSDAMYNLAEAFDVASNECSYDLDYFMKLFLISGIASQFEKGNPKYIAGKSGTELVYDVILRVSDEDVMGTATPVYREPSIEYWVGWVLAYYQWHSAKTFREIHSIITMKELCEMYYPYHEMDEQKIIDYIDKRSQQQKIIRRLQTYRQLLGMSQSELARESGVNLRTLQQYEVGAKDIGKASVSTVLALSNVLKCDVKDLI